MDTHEYKPNSHKYRDEKKELAAPAATQRPSSRKVVRGTATIKQKTELGKLASAFIRMDIHDVIEYVVSDVVVPGVVNLVEDVIVNGSRMLLRGESGRGESRSRADKVSYRKYYDDRDRERDDRDRDRARSVYDYDRIRFSNRADAEAVLNKMQENIEEYGMVTIADLYEFADVRSEHTTYKFGWTSIGSADVERRRDGYYLKLPTPRALN